MLARRVVSCWDVMGVTDGLRRVWFVCGVGCCVASLLRKVCLGGGLPAAHGLATTVQEHLREALPRPELSLLPAFPAHPLC